MILLVDNYDSFTYNLAHMIAEQGVEVVVRRNDEIDADEAERLRPSHLVVSPGPGRPSGSGNTLEIVRRLSRWPTLGVCLGHQAIVEAFGGEVGAARVLVHGKATTVRTDKRGLFENLPEEFEAGRYHSLAATKVPDELEVAATAPDGEIMAVRHRELPVHGVQFHPESVLTPVGPQLIRNFLEAGTSASWGAAGGAGPEGTVLRSTGPESTVPSAASGGGGAGLRPAGAGAGQGGEA